MTDETPHADATALQDSSNASGEKTGKRASEPLYLRPAGDIRSEDVAEIRTLEEGWFVEFKEQTPETSKLARSISSFANSHGGLLVIGAKEDQKSRRLADFTPMPQNIADQCIARARESVTAHVSPPAYFEAKAIEIDTIAADEQARWIVVITVPKGRLGPYLHSNGCIYVRVGDAAAPIRLSDLGQQERLWAESLHRKERIKTRVELLSEQFRQGTPSIHMAILADDLGADVRPCTLKQFREIALAKHADAAGALFDQIQTLDTSFLARRTERQIDAAGLLWDYDIGRNLHFIRIPIATHTWSQDRFDNQADQYGLDSLAERLRKHDVPSDLMVANLLPSLYFLSVIVRKVQALHQMHGYEGDLKLNASIVDAVGTVPYLGTPAYFDEVDATNFPYVLRDVGFFRPLENASSWLRFPARREDGELNSHLQIDVPIAFAAFSQIAQSMGISTYLSLGVRDAEPPAMDWAPLTALFADLHSKSFSFTSQHNPKAKR